MSRVLLVTPPMCQLNAAYAATPGLTGFLKSRGVDASQADLSIELFHRVFSARGFGRVRERLRAGGGPGRGTSNSPSVAFFLERSDEIIAAIDDVVRFLQGKNAPLAWRIHERRWLPEGPRFLAADQADFNRDNLQWAFGSLGVQERAKYYATLFLDELADVVRDGIDPRFGLSRYADRLAASMASFEPLREALEGAPTLVDDLIDELADELLTARRPEVLALTLPFPGNVYGAFRIARIAKRKHPGIKIILGGGYVNTELRSLSDPRVFDYADFVCLDSGERPLLSLLEHLNGKRPLERLHRTFARRDGEVVFLNGGKEPDFVCNESNAPTYEGLDGGRYLSILELLNPMHRLWSDGCWNRLVVAKGCYWRKCAFCDVSLDYIRGYDPCDPDLLVDRMEALCRETGRSGFHFVDEAAPPAALKKLAQCLLDRKLAVTWWANIRFDRAFTPALAELLARSGCVGVTAGLESPCDRLLRLMNKGVTVEQVARVGRAFSEAGVMVHAYLMYGLPTQTVRETVDALEVVRQLFEAGCLHSAYWHRFSVTAHSPVGCHPEKFGIRLARVQEPARLFARNDLVFVDPTGTPHEQLGKGLETAVYNYMHGAGLDVPVQQWFSAKVPKSRVLKRLIASALGGS